ncbi:hypothetical protein [Pseudoxanthomonas sp. JBR18]|uniref:hypothetical protein n=1 Tax=Pseudoxanthomonas sp. JBR18 TaxID=2969308 RepID=UPI002306480E|nr:hypothetical protein [Pseudoxanthomonas sp. JBR18]WCE02776.1 hypothetical protein PJ250_11525 [Pseudoxanthomonas sp. JBR18]
MPPFADASPLLDRWALAALIACALAFPALYLGLYLRDNAAPEVRLEGATVAVPPAFLHATEACRLGPEAVLVRGWVVHKGRGWPLTHSRVVMRLAEGRVVALKTAWLERPDLTDAVHARTGDTVNYHAPGFAASLDLATAGVQAQGAQLFVDWREGGDRVLLPLACPVPAR